MNYGLPGSSVLGILQARILEWVAISSSRGSSQPRAQTRTSYVSCISRQVVYRLSHQGSNKLTQSWWLKTTQKLFLYSSIVQRSDMTVTLRRPEKPYAEVQVGRDWSLPLATSATLPRMQVNHLGSESSSPSEVFRWHSPGWYLDCNFIRNIKPDSSS